MTPFDRAPRKTFPLLLAGLLVSTAACGKKAEDASSSSSVRPASERVLAPDFTLKDTAGKTVALSQLRGKPVFLDFWATWCGPCRQSMPSVEKLHAQYAARGLQVVGLNVDEDPSGVAAFAEKMGVSYPILLVGGSGVDGEYGVSGIPAFLLLDKEGRAANSWVGFEPSFESRWQGAVEKLLAE